MRRCSAHGQGAEKVQKVPEHLKDLFRRDGENYFVGTLEAPDFLLHKSFKASWAVVDKTATREMEGSQAFFDLNQACLYVESRISAPSPVAAP